MIIKDLYPIIKNLKRHNKVTFRTISKHTAFVYFYRILK